MPLGITNDCHPVKDSGARVLGHGAGRPEVYSSLCQDPTFASAQAPAGNELLVLPRQTTDTRESFKYDIQVNTPNSAVASGRSSFVPSEQAVREAATNSRVFGAGTWTPYRSEKPPQGIQMLRPEIPVPVSMDASFMGQPTHGAFNTWQPGEMLQEDPRYQAPKFHSQPALRNSTVPHLRREHQGEALGVHGR